MDDKISFDTKCIHAGQKPESITGAVMTPIFQTSTYAQESPAKHKGYEYSRTHNPTRKALEDNLAALEHGAFGYCFASGCAAVTVIMMALNPGDHVIAMDDLYGGTRRLFSKIFARFGITFSFVDLSKESIDPHFTAKTKLVWLETPSNPLLKLCDIKKITTAAKARKCSVVVDNTFATPALQNPLLLGADLVVHSTTKYIGGHSDVVGGAIITNDKNWAEQVAFLSNSIGGVPGPFDCFLVLRGVKTLHLRMKRHGETAQFIAEQLKAHSRVSRVYFPGLAEHPQAALAREQMRGPTGMISFVVDTADHARRICEQTRLFVCAESLGGVESLIEHPASMTHASINPDDRARIGIAEGLVRISVGIEDASDLWNDLKKAIG